MSRSHNNLRKQIASFLVLAGLIASIFYANALEGRVGVIGEYDPSVGADLIITTNLKQISQDDSANLIAINQPGSILGESDLFVDEEKAQEILDDELKEKEEVAVKIEPPFAVLAVSMDGNGPRFAKNAQKRWPIASITKLMTAIIALEDFPDDSNSLMVSKDAEDIEGIAGGIKTGEIYSIDDLIRTMVTVSSNDAAAAIANRFGMDNFASMMQEKAVSIGMTDTTFMEPTGLSYLNQSSAEDIYKLVRYLYLNHPQVLEYSTKTSTQITEINSGQVKTIGTINKFAGRPDFLGGKTGYTDEAKGNLVSVFKDINNMPVVVIVLGSGDRFEASLDALANYQALLVP